MSKYTQKPPVVDALQFTGGVVNAKAIVEGVEALSEHNTVRYIPAASEFGMEAGVVKEFTTPERLRIDDSSGGYSMDVNLTDWVVVDRDGDVSVYENDAFLDMFQAI